MTIHHNDNNDISLSSIMLKYWDTAYSVYFVEILSLTILQYKYMVKEHWLSHSINEVAFNKYFYFYMLWLVMWSYRLYHKQISSIIIARG